MSILLGQASLLASSVCYDGYITASVFRMKRLAKESLFKLNESTWMELGDRPVSLSLLSSSIPACAGAQDVFRRSAEIPSALWRGWAFMSRPHGEPRLWQQLSVKRGNTTVSDGNLTLPLVASFLYAVQTVSKTHRDEQENRAGW